MKPGGSPSINAKVMLALRCAKVEVARVWHVYSPGDHWALDRQTTVEYTTENGKPMTAVLWTEDRKLKSGSTVKDEKVRVLNGWQGTASWDSPDDD